MIQILYKVYYKISNATLVVSMLISLEHNDLVVALFNIVYTVVCIMLLTFYDYCNIRLYSLPHTNAIIIVADLHTIYLKKEDIGLHLISINL